MTTRHTLMDLPNARHFKLGGGEGGDLVKYHVLWTYLHAQNVSLKIQTRSPRVVCLRIALDSKAIAAMGYDLPFWVPLVPVRRGCQGTTAQPKNH